MATPEFTVNAKIVVNKTLLDWKNNSHRVEGYISLLDTDSAVIQEFPFNVSLKNTDALIRFTHLATQEQLIHALSQTDSEEFNDTNNTFHVLNSIAATKME